MVGRAGHCRPSTRGASAPVFHGRSHGSHGDMRTAAPGILLAACPQSCALLTARVRKATCGDSWRHIGVSLAHRWFQSLSGNFSAADCGHTEKCAPTHAGDLPHRYCPAGSSSHSQWKKRERIRSCDVSLAAQDEEGLMKRERWALPEATW